MDVRGVPVRHLVYDRGGRVAGWYIYYLAPGGVAQVLQVAAPDRDPDLVLDHLFWHAARGGAAAVQGRLEPATFGSLRGRRVRALPDPPGRSCTARTTAPSACSALPRRCSPGSTASGGWAITYSGAPGPTSRSELAVRCERPSDAGGQHRVDVEAGMCADKLWGGAGKQVPVGPRRARAELDAQTGEPPDGENSTKVINQRVIEGSPAPTRQGACVPSPACGSARQPAGWAATARGHAGHG